jgi:hypothetical protein
MTTMLKDILECYPDTEFIIIDGHDNAVIGVTEAPNGLHLLYRLSTIYDNLLNVHGLESYTECEEWYQFNMLDLGFLSHGPVYLEDTLINSLNTNTIEKSA